MQKVYLPKSAPWKEHVLSQLLKFPAGKHDDAVDVLSLIGRGLQQIAPPAPKAAERPQTWAPPPQGPHGWMAY